MEVKIKDNKLTIELDMDAPQKVSKSGKMMTVDTTGGLMTLGMVGAKGKYAGYKINVTLCAPLPDKA